MKSFPSNCIGYVGEALGPLKGKGVENYLEIIIYTRLVDGHLKQAREALGRLQLYWLSVFQAILCGARRNIN